MVVDVTVSLDGTDHDVLELLVAQRTDSYVYQRYSVLATLWLVARYGLSRECCTAMVASLRISRYIE